VERHERQEVSLPLSKPHCRDGFGTFLERHQETLPSGYPAVSTTNDSVVRATKGSGVRMRLFRRFQRRNDQGRTGLDACETTTEESDPRAL
jgi:hypothetical protein